MTENNICPICGKSFDSFNNRYMANNGQVACSEKCYQALKDKLGGTQVKPIKCDFCSHESTHSQVCPDGSVTRWCEMCWEVEQNTDPNYVPSEFEV